MKMYKVAVTVSAEQFMNLFPRIGKDFQLEIKEIDSGQKDLFQNAPKRGGRRKGSKVNDAVLQALANGPQTVKQLKSALENAGLAPGRCRPRSPICRDPARSPARRRGSTTFARPRSERGGSQTQTGRGG